MTTRILYLAANPRQSTRLKLEEEAQVIADRIDSNDLELIPVFALSWSLLIDAMTDLQPDIVHFSGHGTRSAEILLERNGASHPLVGQAVADLFGAQSRKVQLVVVNACYSIGIAREIRKYVGCAIGTTSALPDATAIKFAGRFYFMLSRGRTVAEAFEAARFELKGEGDANHAIFQQEYGPGVDPAQIRFTPPRGPLQNGEAFKLRKVFIVQPVGRPDSPIRARADRVMTELIQPACDRTRYEPIRAHELPAPTVTEPIVSSLFTQSLVIADLGGAPWNPNVMIEVGYRIATAKPIVLLVDDHDGSDGLPIHLQNRRHLSIDPSHPEQALEQLVEYIRASQDTVGDKSAWESQYAYVDFKLALRRGQTSAYVFANAKAVQIYGMASVDEIVGQPVESVDNKLLSYLPRAFCNEFIRDQQQLCGAIVTALSSRSPVTASASVPLWLAEHPNPNEKGKFYLPILVQHRYDEVDQSIVMRVAYVDISQWRARDTHNRPPKDLRIPSVFREFNHYAHDVFLCYDSADFPHADALRRMLNRVGFRVWWPSDDHCEQEDRHLTPARLTSGLSRSRIAAVLLGVRGRGRWETCQQLDSALYSHCAFQKPVVLFLMPDYDGPADDSFLGDRFKDVLNDPLYIVWRAEDRAKDPSALDRPRSFSERVLTELVKLLQQ